MVNWTAVEPFVDVSEFAKRYERLRNLAMRAQSMNRGQAAVAPSAAIAWAIDVGVEIPVGLQAAMDARKAKQVSIESQAAPVPAATPNNAIPAPRLMYGARVWKLSEAIDALAAQHDLSAYERSELYAKAADDARHGRMWVRDTVGARRHSGRLSAMTDDFLTVDINEWLEKVQQVPYRLRDDATRTPEQLPEVPAAQPLGVRRADNLRRELQEIIRELRSESREPAWPAVLEKLKIRAKDGGTIFEVMPDAVKWYRASGKLGETSIRDVQRRLNELLKAE